jgi:hypothetical protein
MRLSHPQPLSGASLCRSISILLLSRQNDKLKIIPFEMPVNGAPRLSDKKQIKNRPRLL